MILFIFFSCWEQKFSLFFRSVCLALVPHLALRTHQSSLTCLRLYFFHLQFHVSLTKMQIKSPDRRRAEATVRYSRGVFFFFLIDILTKLGDASANPPACIFAAPRLERREEVLFCENVLISVDLVNQTQELQFPNTSYLLRPPLLDLWSGLVTLLIFVTVTRVSRLPFSLCSRDSGLSQSSDGNGCIVLAENRLERAGFTRQTALAVASAASAGERRLVVFGRQLEAFFRLVSSSSCRTMER